MCVGKLINALADGDSVSKVSVEGCDDLTVEIVAVINTD